MSSLLLWIITIVLFSLGLLGVFIPALPGVALVFAGVLVYGLATNFSSISVTTTVVFGVVALLAWLVEYVGALIGVKMGGGGRYALLGMIVGGLLGLMAGGPIGLVIGVVLGALVGALTEGKTPEEAGRAALFSILGIIGAKMVQMILAVSIIVAFLIALLI